MDSRLNFGNDGGGSSPLNGSIVPHPSTLKVSVIPLSVIPECLYQESKLFKGKSMDSRLKISGMTEGGCHS
jgi:hypothetical protein